LQDISVLEGKVYDCESVDSQTELDLLNTNRQSDGILDTSQSIIDPYKPESKLTHEELTIYERFSVPKPAIAENELADFTPRKRIKSMSLNKNALYNKPNSYI